MGKKSGLAKKERAGQDISKFFDKGPTQTRTHDLATQKHPPTNQKHATETQDASRSSTKAVPTMQPSTYNYPAASTAAYILQQRSEGCATNLATAAEKGQHQHPAAPAQTCAHVKKRGSTVEQRDSYKTRDSHKTLDYSLLSLDNVALSQEDDLERVIWQASPNRPHENSAVDRDTDVGDVHQLAVLRKHLAQAAQKPKPKDLRSLIACSTLNHSEAVLDKLLSFTKGDLPPKHGAAEATTGVTVTVPMEQRDALVERPRSEKTSGEACQATTGETRAGDDGRECPPEASSGLPDCHTPAEALRVARRVNGKGGALSGLRNGSTVTPATVARFTGSLKRNRLGSGDRWKAGCTTVKKSTGRKKKLLLKLLDQVELLVSKRNLQQEFTAKPGHNPIDHSAKENEHTGGIHYSAAKDCRTVVAASPLHHEVNAGGNQREAQGGGVSGGDQQVVSSPRRPKSLLRSAYSHRSSELLEMLEADLVEQLAEAADAPRLGEAQQGAVATASCPMPPPDLNQHQDALSLGQPNPQQRQIPMPSLTQQPQTNTSHDLLHSSCSQPTLDHSSFNTRFEPPDSQTHDATTVASTRFDHPRQASILGKRSHPNDTYLPSQQAMNPSQAPYVKPPGGKRSHLNHNSSLTLDTTTFFQPSAVNQLSSHTADKGHWEAVGDTVNADRGIPLGTQRLASSQVSGSQLHNPVGPQGFPTVHELIAIDRGSGTAACGRNGSMHVAHSHPGNLNTGQVPAGRHSAHVTGVHTGNSAAFRAEQGCGQQHSGMPLQPTQTNCDSNLGPPTNALSHNNFHYAWPSTNSLLEDLEEEIAQQLEEAALSRRKAGAASSGHVLLTTAPNKSCGHSSQGQPLATSQNKSTGGREDLSQPLSIQSLSQPVGNAIGGVASTAGTPCDMQLQQGAAYQMPRGQESGTTDCRGAPPPAGPHSGTVCHRKPAPVPDVVDYPFMPVQPSQPTHTSCKRFPADRERLRNVVIEVEDAAQQKTLRVLNEFSGEETRVHLRDSWASTPVAVGDSINLIADVMVTDGQRDAVLDWQKGLLVLHPDLLLSGTRISSSFNCTRSAVLEELIGGSSNAKAVEGTLLHELFQAILMDQLRSPEAARQRAQQLVRRNTDKLLEVNLDESQAMAFMDATIPALLQFVNTFVKSEPSPNGVVQVVRDFQGQQTTQMCVQDVLDIEESIWSPKYGIKGQIDASLRVKVVQSQNQVLKSWMNGGSNRKTTSRELLVPFELKTGKDHISHRAQVSLYFLLLEERYRQAVDSGLLWYTSQAAPQLVTRVDAEMSSLIQQRNLLAAYLIAPGPLPPMKRVERACSRCFQLANCTLLHKSLEDGTSATADMGGVFAQQTQHICLSHAKFLSHWWRLVQMEEEGLVGKKAEVWAIPGEDRERQGRCMSGLVLADTSTSGFGNSGADNDAKFLYTFRKLAALPAATQALSQKVNLAERGLAEGDMVVISTEGSHPGLARGFVHQLTSDSVTVSLRKLIPPSSYQTAPSEVVTWRLDLDEVASTFTILRQNLMSLFGADNARVRKLRRLIVDLQPPAASAPASELRLALEQKMNEEQQQAVARIVGVRDYVLLLGMPGTGKTTTICEAVKTMVKRGKSVLLSSYTNSAVDNILLKLKEEDVDFVRLGRASSVHPMLQAYVPGGSRFPDTSVAALRTLIHTVHVVGCTCLGINHPLLASRAFDVCIVDEASQITLPSSIGPLTTSRSFVLVGDHYQLPPLVTNPQAAAGGMDCSLFRRLSEAQPQAVVTLRSQYRMCADIMLLPNTLVYNGALRCPSEAVAQASLHLPPSTLQFVEQQPAWLQQILSPDQHVVFLDTDPAGVVETRGGDKLFNEVEATVIMRIVNALVAVEVPQHAIGLVSPYRSQVTYLQRLARGCNMQELEVLTVDKYQGRDKDCILLSLVRSNAGCKAGQLLADWRRINVAITRAKKKLVVVGSKQTCSSIPLLDAFIKLVQSRGWYHGLHSRDIQ